MPATCDFDAASARTGRGADGSEGRMLVAEFVCTGAYVCIIVYMDVCAHLEVRNQGAVSDIGFDKLGRG